MERNSVPNRKCGGFTLIGVMLGLTAMAMIGSASLAFCHWFRVCNGESEAKDQAERVVNGLTNYKDYYGIWPYFGDANGEPEQSTYGLIDYVFPVGNWFEVQRYGEYLPAILSGENRFGCNPLGKCFEEFGDELSGKGKIYRFWVYLRKENPSNLEELEEPFRLWERLARKITGKDEYNNDILEKITNVPADEICGCSEALFYIPKPNETLKWQPLASEKVIEWTDGGKQKRDTGPCNFLLKEDVDMSPLR